MYEYTIYTYNSEKKKVVLDFISGKTGSETVAEIHAIALERLEEIRAKHGTGEAIRMGRRCRVGI